MADSKAHAEGGSERSSPKLDTATGIIHSAGMGFWHQQDVERYFAELEAVVASVRRNGGEIRILVDLRGIPVQSPGTISRIASLTGRIYTADDCIALVINSSLTKMQVRRTLGSARQEIFMSPEAAIAWLTNPV